jgi:surface protein
MKRLAEGRLSCFDSVINRIDILFEEEETKLLREEESATKPLEERRLAELTRLTERIRAIEAELDEAKTMLETVTAEKTEREDQLKKRDRYAFTNADLKEAVNLWCNNRQEALERYGPISKWNTSKVTDMSNLFLDQRNFNDDISSWDVSNVTNMYRTFSGAMTYNQPLNTWDVRNVTNMGCTFHLSAFNQPLSDWKVNKVTTMTIMTRVRLVVMLYLMEIKITSSFYSSILYIY